MFKLSHKPLISPASKVMLKILQVRLQQYVKQEFLDVQVGFRKGRGTRNHICNICWIIKKAREIQENIYFTSLTTLKPLTVWITINCGTFLKRWDYHLTCLLRNPYADHEATVRPGYGKKDCF